VPDSVGDYALGLIGLSRNPGPDELAAFINTDQSLVPNPKGNEGIDVRDNDGDTLFALGASGMNDALRPIVQVFFQNDEMPLLLELFETLYLHWPTAAGGDYQDSDPATPRYSLLSGIRTYEPLLIDVFDHTHVVDSLQALLDDTQDLNSQEGTW